ncbi:MAG: response regulator [Chloroflexi bacterium]|nr:response regulator [Chloroflexota bacterium]
MTQSFRNAETVSYGNVRALHHAWRVVIAEDEVLPAELLKRMLVRLGHTVVGNAQNGLEVIALTRELKPDIVLMDLRMPVMDGWTATAELARDLVAPIVIVSALDDRESLELAVAAGASAFLTKPVREDDLERALELAVARFADLQEIRKWRADAERRAQEQGAQAQELAKVVRELREAQLQLVTAARRAAIASLARSLTHEINNALTPIIGYAQMLAILHAHEPETLERTNQIVEHAQRIAGWTAAFRQISVGAHRERIPFSFNGIARDVLDLYSERLARLGIVLSVELDENLPVMQGYPDQLQEVLMNLIQNSVEALKGEGAIHFSTCYLRTQDTVLATLTDSGIGIAPGDLAHVTEPGYTTKHAFAEDTSLGWGLFTANQIVKAHQGVLEIASPAEGHAHGTTVRMRLPLNSDLDK